MGHCRGRDGRRVVGSRAPERRRAAVLLAEEIARIVMWRAFIAVAVGGALGRLFRWYLAIALTRYLPAIPPGTLAANLIGCYVIGAALGLFIAYPDVPL